MAQAARAQSLTVPSQAQAGDPVTISIQSAGTLYVFGPGLRVKKEVKAGQEVTLSAEQAQFAGRYTALLCTSSCESAQFAVTPAQVGSLGFLVHPSRLPAGERDGISGVVLPFDKFGNLILEPVAVNLSGANGGATLLTQKATTRMGTAWFRLNSGTRTGTVQMTASVNNISVGRAVHLVSADPCRLHFNAQRTSHGVEVQTDPIHDCAGNPVTDGTIITFTAVDSKGKSSVDAPAKQGVARATLLLSGEADISVASGVVQGNEIRVRE
jgi:hypothetical protein